jgi:hypothetical protein
MRLRRLGPDLWQLEHELRLPGGVRMPVNATLIRLPDGGSLLYSPVPIDDAIAAEIEAIGPVRHLVAPSLMHHLWAGDAVRRWPNARLHAAPGLRAKRPDLRIDAELGERGEPPEWGGALDTVRVAGVDRLSEVVLFHRPSRTLVCADLVFHITRPANLATRMVLAAGGTGGGRLAQSRLWRLFTRDRAAARASTESILGWPIAGIAVTHGEPYDASDAREALARALGG